MIDGHPSSSRKVEPGRKVFPRQCYVDAMVALPGLVFGTLSLLAGLRVFLAAEAEFASAMRLRGIDPDDAAEPLRSSAVFRNRVVGALFVFLGVFLLGWGVLG